MQGSVESYFHLKSQLSDLQQRVDQAREAVKKDAIARIRREMSEFGITPADLGGRRGRTLPKPPAKYRDPVTGATWTGRGREPAWIRGKDPRDFEIDAS
ncbi:H-NS family nucleoid-associated regulatory protein [Burkholderia ubonensis]|uniref:H-NS histone family protein n=1 Tax=Burkholderia ubonensis TaxID=101571 RepID=UPI000758CC1A|nr:H-NS histone family protein [Burkholderia ubonensis]KWE97920.1 hypothetical protein WL81_02515 [Burkholderia ubonensis]